MHFTPSHRLTSRLVPQPNPTSVATSQPIPVFAAVKRRSGLRHYPRCVFRGFYDPEVARGRPHMWTADQAAVECHFSAGTKLQYVWIEVGNTAPQGATVDVYLNDELLVQNKTIRGRASICARLPEARVLASVSLSIHTTTFVPGQLFAQCDDCRELGIAVRAIVFGKRRSKYRAGSCNRDSLNERIVRVVKTWWAHKAA